MPECVFPFQGFVGEAVGEEIWAPAPFTAEKERKLK